MNAHKDRLFTEGDFSNLNISYPQMISAEMDKIGKEEFVASSEDDLTQRIIKSLTISPLEIHEDEISKATEDIKVDVAGDLNRGPWGDGPCLRPGTRLTLDLPYSGDGGLFKFRPSSLYMSPLPHGQIISHGNGGGVIRMIFEFPNDEKPERIKQRINDNIRYTKECLQSQKKVIDQFHETLPKGVRDAIKAKSQQLGRQSNLLDALDIPDRKSPDTPQTRTTHDRRPDRPSFSTHAEIPNADRGKRPHEKKNTWDLFISHASEDKESFVRALAEALRAQGPSVWYDDFTLTLGDSLRRSIDYGLANSRFGVVVLSHNFFAKDWPQKELDGLVAKEHSAHKVILPIWHDINKEEVAEYSPLLADRLAVSSTKGLDHVVSEILRALERTK